MNRLLVAFLGASLSLGACNSSQPVAQPTGPVAETTAPKDAPVTYKVLADTTDSQANTVEYHALLAAPLKHDDMEKLLKYLYRHLMTRGEDKPAALAAYVYTDLAQYQTPPRSPLASVVQKSGDFGPTFENKVPLEFWQSVDQALNHSDKGWKLEKKVVRDDAHKTLTITVPYTEPGVDRWADRLSYNQAMVVFTDTARSLFDKVPELQAMTYIGRWKDQDVLKISLDRPQYQALQLADLEEQIGQLHGRAFLELATGRGSDAKVSKDNAKRMADLYKKRLAPIKRNLWVARTLK